VTTTEVLTHDYTPRGGPREVFYRRDPEVCLVGPAGTGKSLACLEKLNAVALKYPGMRGLITRKTQVSLASSALVTWRKLVIPELLNAGFVVFHGGGPQDPPQYRYANGSVINIGGMDKSSKIMSTEYDIVFAQEATELSTDDWESITTRLRNWVMPYQQIIADCNPSTPTHWLNLRGQSGKTVMIPTHHEDNPALFDENGVVTDRGKEYLSKLDSLTGVRYLRLRKGLWAAAEGVIYEDWDESKHLIDSFPIPQSWRRWWSVDFGFTHPMVLQCWAEDPDGRLYLYRELYHTKRLVEDQAKRILNIVRPDGKRWIEPEPYAIVCDHDAEDRATLERHLGRSVVAAKKDVKPGIEAVQLRLRDAGDGKPRIFIFRDALVDRDNELADMKRPTCTADEITGYVWAPGKEGQPSKEEPVKDMDDGCLVAGTMVTTDHGNVAIENVTPGMRVLTRTRYHTVSAAGMTSQNATVFSVRLSDGTSLTGTGNHPVLVYGSWVRLDALRYGDRLLRLQSTDTVEYCAADVYVLSVNEQVIHVPVYNLTVDGSHEYFANGVLVHNCDTLRYIVAQLDLVGRPRIRTFSLNGAPKVW